MKATAKSIGSTARKFIVLVLSCFCLLEQPAAFAESDDQRDLTNVLTGLDVDMSLKKQTSQMITTVPIIVDNEKDDSFNETLVSGSTILSALPGPWRKDFYGQVEGDYFTIDLPPIILPSGTPP